MFRIYIDGIQDHSKDQNHLQKLCTEKKTYEHIPGSSSISISEGGWGGKEKEEI